MGQGLVAVRTPAEVTAAKNIADMPITQERQILALVQHVSNAWQRARDHKVSSGITERLLRCDRQRKGVYDPEKLAEIRKFGGSEIYMMLTDIKCRAAESWIKDVMNSFGDDIWAMEPGAKPLIEPSMHEAIVQAVAQEAIDAHEQGLTEPSPLAFKMRIDEMQDEVRAKLKEQARDACDRMAAHIDQQLTDGKWESALFDFYTDFATYPAAFIEGPLVKRQRVLAWSDKGFKPIVKEEVRRTFERISPYDIFPSDDATSMQDGYLCVRKKFTIKGLNEVRNVPGYRAEEIDKVIDSYARGGLTNWLYGDTEKRMIDNGGLTGWISPSSTIEGVVYWGFASGKMLKEWGIKAKVEDTRSYDVTCTLIGGHVIRAVINPDPLGRRPYMKACFEHVPGSFWGQAIPELMHDVQGMCNAAARALANNIAIASGPQAEVVIDRLPHGETVTAMYPWKVWQTTSDKTGGGQPAVRFFQPQMNAESLMAVFQHFSRQADETTGIPNYVYGSGNTGGAGRTASGLAMLMDNASKGIKQAISNIDEGVGGVIEQMYNHNMLFDTDDSIKGTMKVLVKGALGMVMREQRVEKLQQFLAATANPVDAEIMGRGGRSYLLREAAKPLHLDTDRIVPDDRKLNAQAEAQALAAARQQTPPDSAPVMGPDGQPSAIVNSQAPGHPDSGRVIPLPPGGSQGVGLRSE